jgi:hypothetical protein
LLQGIPPLVARLRARSSVGIAEGRGGADLRLFGMGGWGVQQPGASDKRQPNGASLRRFGVSTLAVRAGAIFDFSTLRLTDSVPRSLTKTSRAL